MFFACELKTKQTNVNADFNNNYCLGIIRIIMTVDCPYSTVARRDTYIEIIIKGYCHRLNIQMLYIIYR